MSTDPNASQNTARISPNQARARSEEYFNTIVDKELSQLAGNYLELINFSQIEGKDRYQIMKEKLDLDMCAANITRSVENMLGLIADMKKSVLVNDFSTMNELSEERLEVLREEESALLQQLQSLAGKSKLATVSEPPADQP